MTACYCCTNDACVTAVGRDLCRACFEQLLTLLAEHEVGAWMGWQIRQWGVQ